MTARSIKAAAALMTASSLLAVSACGGGGGQNTSGGAQGDVEQQLGFDQASLDVRLSRAEARIPDFVKGQGFDYVPIDPAARRSAPLAGDRGSDQEAQFGYYVTTLWGRATPQADPSERIRATLSP